MTLADLPLLNAWINIAVALLLVAGYVLIRRGRREAHERVMVAAIILSTIFLVSYVTHHVKHGATRFTGEGLIRPVYFAVLISHTILAIVNLPFVIVTFARGVRRDLPGHVRLAKRTWAIWLYVAITGPLVYVMLHHLTPPASAAPAGAAGGPGREALGVFLEGQALQRAAKEPEALAAYRRAAALGSRPARCWAAVLGDRLEGTKTASAALHAALAEDPAEQDCRVLLARELVWEERSTEAVPLLEEAVKADPNNAFYWSSLGYAQFRRMRYQLAAQAFERSLALEPAMNNNRFNAGYAHFLEGSWGTARPLLLRALDGELDTSAAEQAKESLGVIEGRLWTCPMHPNEIGEPGGKCGECGMALSRAESRP